MLSLLHMFLDMGCRFWMKTCLSDHSYRGLTVTHQESGRALARVQSGPAATAGQIPRVEFASVASTSALKHPNSVAPCQEHSSMP